VTTRRKLATRAQALRAFRQLLSACDMSPQDYIRTLRRFAELAEELADDEMIVQRIYANQAMERVATARWLLSLD